MKTTGFTLIELMVAVAIAGVLLSIGVISYRSYAERNGVESDIRHVQSMGRQAMQYSFTNHVHLQFRLSGGDKTAAWVDDGGIVYKGLEYFAKNKIIADQVSFNNGVQEGESSAVVYIAESGKSEYSCVLFEKGRIRVGQKYAKQDGRYGCNAR